MSLFLSRPRPASEPRFREGAIKRLGDLHFFCGGDSLIPNDCGKCAVCSTLETFNAPLKRLCLGAVGGGRGVLWIRSVALRLQATAPDKANVNLSHRPLFFYLFYFN